MVSARRLLVNLSLREPRKTGWLLVTLLLCLTAPLNAKVVEQLDYAHYEVDPEGYDKLYQAVNAVTPVKVDGKTFHGLTKWHIKWNYWFDNEEDGSCAITRTRVTLTATITLPQLVNSEDWQDEIFDEYLDALTEHEMGHYEISQEAAQAIDDALNELDAEDDCTTLKQVANQSARELLNEFRQAERDYDKRTDHGRTQGARLRD